MAPFCGNAGGWVWGEMRGGCGVRRVVRGSEGVQIQAEAAGHEQRQRGSQQTVHSQYTLSLHSHTPFTYLSLAHSHYTLHYTLTTLSLTHLGGVFTHVRGGW
jgi:hypothetical protein